jgi:hypothetical protein
VKFSLSLACLLCAGAAFGNDPTHALSSERVQSSHEVAQSVVPYEAYPFTGQIASKGVRLRTSPDLDSHIIRELSVGEHVLIIGEVDDFYAVQPSPDTKLYIFRSFVLDGVVEAQNVNVRTGPSLSDPVVTRLQSGTPVHGMPCAKNAKWLEISPPENTHFYLSKDYVKRIGGPEVIHELHAQKESLDEEFMALHIAINEQKQKPYEEMQLQVVERLVEKVRADYPTFKADIAKAEALYQELKDDYLAKKVIYLERQFQNNVISVPEADKSASVDASKKAKASSNEAITQRLETSPEAALKWKNIEYARYLNWVDAHPDQPMADFYKEERLTASRVTGELSTFECDLAARPGDYILKQKGLAVAYLYSTLVDLSALEGQEVSLVVVPRPNNDFAFPTYFVIAAE